MIDKENRIKILFVQNEDQCRANYLEQKEEVDSELREKLINLIIDKPSENIIDNGIFKKIFKRFFHIISPLNKRIIPYQRKNHKKYFYSKQNKFLKFVKK